MIRMVRPAMSACSAWLPRLFAPGVCLLMAAQPPANQKVQPAPTMREAQSRFYSRNADQLLLGADPTLPVRPQIVPANPAPCKVMPDDPKWVDPTTVHADGGPVQLTAAFATSNIGGVQVKHRSYNQASVGPVIRVKQGQTLTVDLQNNLPAEPSGSMPSATPTREEPHGFNTTNLHTHGLHVSPRGNSDNIFPPVSPGAARKFVYCLRNDHPAGTFWYHAHKHGSVGLQLSSGMAGALIVEGGIDCYPPFQTQHIAEKVMVFEQVVYYKPDDPTQQPEVIPEDIYSTMKPKKPKVQVTLINGQYIPVITMKRREVQRWRMVHAGIQTTINVHLEGHTQSEIAEDGLPLRAIRRVQFAELQPAYRSDVLIQASDQPGVYCLYNSVDDAATAFKNLTSPPEILAKVVVLEGDPMANQSLPDSGDWTKFVNDLYDKAMPDLKDVADIEVPVVARELTFNHAGIQVFTIDGKVFDETRIDQRITLGAVEKWNLKVDPSGTKDNHPFHIHVNPFQVQVSYPEEGISRWVWRDTFLITPLQPVEIRSRFLHFPGKTVLHCHNLDHEDHGMMEAICIIDPKENPPDPDCPPPAPAKPATPNMVGKLAPIWRLKDASGREVASADYQGRPLLLVFHRGFICQHCGEQVELLGRSAGAFRDLGVDVLVVSPGAQSDGQTAAQADGLKALRLLRDPTLDAFKAFDCFTDGHVLHGVFLIDSKGLVRWGRFGNQPETDIGLILENARKFDGRPRGQAGPVATR